MRRVLRGLDVSLGDLNKIHERARVFVPDPVYLDAMDFSNDEDSSTISNHSLWWLSREELLGWNPGGSVEYLSSLSGHWSANAFLRLPAQHGMVEGIDIRLESCRLDDPRTKTT
jgi:hypothetical protein